MARWYSGGVWMSVVVCFFSSVQDLMANNKNAIVVSHHTIGASALEQSVAQNLGQDLVFPRLTRFADGELNIQLEQPEQFLDKDVVVVQSTCAPVNEHLLGLSFLVQELKNANARRVVAVVPYFGYARQEVSCIPGKAGHAALVAKLFESAGIDALVTVDLHTPEVEALFSVPVHNILIHDTIAAHIKKQFNTLDDICLVAPDEGAKEPVRAVADILGLEMIVFSKERYAADKTRVVGSSGTCRGKKAILIDDIIDTGGTAINVAHELVSMGFEEIYGYFSHPVLSRNAVQKVAASPFKTIFVANTIPLSDDAQKSNIVSFDVSDQITRVVEELL